MAARHLSPEEFAELLRSLKAEATARPPTNVCLSFEEYRWQLDHAFTGYAPRAGEINIYEQPASGGYGGY